MSSGGGSLTPTQRRVVVLCILISIASLLPAEFRSSWMRSAGVVIQIAAAWFVSVAVHEAGHLLGATIVRFKVWSIGIWPCKLYRARDGVWRAGWSGLRLAGFVVAHPAAADPQDGQNIRRREWVATAAGPVASALAAIGFGVAAANAGGGWLRWPAVLLESAALVSAYFGMAAFLPSRSSRFVSDAMRLRMLRRPGPEADRYCALSLLLGASMAGSPPWEWRSELVDMLAWSAGNSSDAFNALILKYLYCLHGGRLEEAAQALEAGLEKAPQEVRANMFLEAAWFAARIQGDRAKASQWMYAASAIPESRQIPCGFSRPQSAIALLDGKWDKVELHAKETLRQCDRLENRGFALAMQKETEALLCDVASLRAGEPLAIPVYT